MPKIDDKAARRARNDTIAAFDDAVRLVGGYIERCQDSDERGRLIGVLPALREVRHQFEVATLPDEEEG